MTLTDTLIYNSDKNGKKPEEEPLPASFMSSSYGRRLHTVEKVEGEGMGKWGERGKGGLP